MRDRGCRPKKAYRITPEQAEVVLAWKADHPGADWLLVTPFEPDFDPDPDQLTGMLTHTDVRLRTQARPVEADEAVEPPADDDGEPVLAYPCERVSVLRGESIEVAREERCLANISCADEACGLYAAVEDRITASARPARLPRGFRRFETARCERTHSAVEARLSAGHRRWRLSRSS